MRRFLPLLLAALLLGPASMTSALALARADVAPVASATSARDLLLDAIGERKLVLLGEMHGTQETPALLGGLLDAYAQRQRPVLLALEIDAGEQASLDRYLASQGTRADRDALLAGPHWREPMHDGRDSAAMFALIEHARHLHAGGAAIALVAFDHGGAQMEARNRRMADALRAAARRSPGATLLVLTGNVHAMTRRPPWEMFSDGKRIEPPMTAGRQLADLAPLSIDIRGASGAHWACMQGACHVQPEPPSSARTAPGLHRNDSDGAWDYELLLPRFTPSPPAITVVDAAGAPATRAVNP